MDGQHRFLCYCLFIAMFVFCESSDGVLCNKEDGWCHLNDEYIRRVQASPKEVKLPHFFTLRYMRNKKTATNSVGQEARLYWINFSKPSVTDLKHKPAVPPLKKGDDKLIKDVMKNLIPEKIGGYHTVLSTYYWNEVQKATFYQLMSAFAGDLIRKFFPNYHIEVNVVQTAAKGDYVFSIDFMKRTEGPVIADILKYSADDALDIKARQSETLSSLLIGAFPKQFKGIEIDAEGPPPPPMKPQPEAVESRGESAPKPLKPMLEQSTDSGIPKEPAQEVPREPKKALPEASDSGEQKNILQGGKSEEAAPPLPLRNSRRRMVNQDEVTEYSAAPQFIDWYAMIVTAMFIVVATLMSFFYLII